MPKIIKYSEVLSKLNKKVHLPVKKIDTIILDTDKIYDLDEEKYAKDLNNIVISKNLLKEKYTDIRIKNTRTKNIYVENLPNFGGITIPYDIINDNIDILITFNEISEISKINILNIRNIKNIPLNLEKNLKSISLKKDNGELLIEVNYKKKRIYYRVDSLGNINEKKSTYIITEEDIYNDTLNITKLTEYDNLVFPDAKIDTLIINKHYIENINKLSSLNHGRLIPFHEKMLFKNLRIIDDNDMILIPFDKTFNNNGYNTNFRDRKNNYIYINNKENSILIYLDKNNNIKVLDRNELLNKADVENVLINYKETNFLLHNIPNLILIKYKDYYKIIDFDNEFILKDDFFYLLSSNSKKYFQENNLYKALKNKDFITIYNSNEFSYNLFYKMYEDYLKFKNYIEKIKTIGFNENAIKYLFDKKFNNIINPEKNIIGDISDNEIKHFNEMANDYVKVKRLNYEKK